MKNLKTFEDHINESENVMNIIELSKMVSRLGIDKDSILNILQKEYQRGGDEAVISMFKEMTGINIEALRRGAYIFKY